MIDGAEWPLETRGAIPTDHQQPFCEVDAPLTTNPIEPFANGFGDRGRQAFSGQFGKLLGEPVGLLILDIHAHACIPFYLYIISFYRSVNSAVGRGSLRRAEADPRSAVTRADQVYARLFEGALNDLQGGPPGNGVPALKQANCLHPNPGLIGQLLLGPG